MKKITSVREVTMGEEDKAELNPAATAAGVKGTKDGKPAAGSPNEKTSGVSHPKQTTDKSMSSMTQDGPNDHPPQASSTTTAETSKEKEHAGVPKREVKLTPGQKAKIDEIGEERDTAMDARIEELTRKLKDVSTTLISPPSIGRRKND
jgi:hypothetical protein